MRGGAPECQWGHRRGLRMPRLPGLRAQAGTKHTNKLALGLGDSEVVRGHALGSPGEHSGCLPGRDAPGGGG